MPEDQDEETQRLINEISQLEAEYYGEEKK